MEVEVEPAIVSAELSPSHLTWYRRAEIANVWTHAFAFVLGLGAYHLLMQKALAIHDREIIFACRVYGCSVLLTFFASSIYHALTQPRMKEIFHLLDHLLIYLMIAGTYTPFTLILLKGDWGTALFGVIWSLALFGIIFKAFTIGRDRILSTVLYVLMGWMALIAIVPIMENLPFAGLMWLIGGGVIYTVGVLFYALESVPFAHSVWHVMVILGAACHFVCIYNYVL